MYQVLNQLEIKIKKLREDAQLPSHGSEQAAGYDLYACIDESSLIIPAHSTKLIPTGLSMALPEGTFLGIYPRSGLASKKGLRPANCVGVIDSDYRGEIMVALHNDTGFDQTIQNGERIAQGILQFYMGQDYKLVDDLDETDRGEGGFGSTGETITTTMSANDIVLE